MFQDYCRKDQIFAVMNASFLGKSCLTNRKMWTVPIIFFFVTEHNSTASLKTPFSSVVQDNKITMPQDTISLMVDVSRAVCKIQTERYT